MSHEENQLWNIRHSAEHILTMAMEKLYGADTIIMAMGPATDDGFYYDFEARHGFQMTEEKFADIEAEMQRLIDAGLIFVREEVEPTLAQQVFANNPYKQEWISEAAARGEAVSLYYTGRPEDIEQAKELVHQGQRPNLAELEVFVDLCKGPHVEQAREIKAFTLLKLAGAYWRGDEKNIMLTRIYGTAYSNPKELRLYLQMLEEAKKRDHRKLGKELDLFTFSDLVGPGLPLWTPKGTLLRNTLDNFVWSLRAARGYQKVEIPHITKKDLYETSGHWAKFSEELFRITTREGHEFAMKPMNCPHHTQIFARKPHSYREMPQRYANTTMCYRDEQTGELSGLSRVRAFTQDDAHVFCRKNQVREEMLKIWDIVESFYGAFHIDLKIRLSLHDPEHPEKYLGEQADWMQAEEEIRQIATSKGVEFVEAPGEAAFYGPKIDFMGHDSLGREWQVATIQLDMNMPERFNLFCINEQGEEERIVMIHAAIMGSIERFLSVIIEHLAGVFPSWLAPIQAVIVPVSGEQVAYADQLRNFLTESGIRVELSDEAETMQNRIRKAEEAKVPYILVVGEKEQSAHEQQDTPYASAVRQRGRVNLGVMSGEEFLRHLEAEKPGEML